MARDDGCREAIRDLRRNQVGRTGDELAEILERFGFAGKDRRTGLNRVFSRDDCDVTPTFPLGHRPTKRIYVLAVIQALQEICDE